MYAYGQTPPGQKNVPLNPDGSPHNCMRGEGAPTPAQRTVTNNTDVFNLARNELIIDVTKAIEEFLDKVLRA